MPAAELRQAAASASTKIQGNLALWRRFRNGLAGSLGSVLLLAAIGLAITFGVMGIINMAHGEMVMLGAYTTFVGAGAHSYHNPALFDYSLVIAVPLAFVVAGAVGIAIERSIIRFLYGRPLETLLATWGLSLILQQAVRTIFGPTNKEVGNPSWMSGAFDLGGITITYNRLWIICFTLAVFVALLGMLRFTRLGLEMRAVTQNRSMAAAMGIRTARSMRWPSGWSHRHRRRGAVADRQRLTQSGSRLHHRFVHGCGLRRRRQSVGHSRWRIHARHRKQIPRALCRRCAWQDCHSRPHHSLHSEASAGHVRAQGPSRGGLNGRLPAHIDRLDKGSKAFFWHCWRPSRSRSRY